MASTQISGFQDQELPANLHAFDDVGTKRKLIYDNALSAVKAKFPYTDGKYRMEIADVRYDGPQTFTWAEQKRAMLTDRSLRTPIKAKISLHDDTTGIKLDEKEETLMHVPYYTDRGTIVNRGSDYVVNNQSRLKSGVFARTKKSGEHEAQFNVKQGTGTGFRMWMEPSTGVFRVMVGQANIPAYQFLKTLGVDDKAMEAAWGPELLQKNQEKHDSKAVDKLYAKFAGRGADPEVKDKEQGIRDIVSKMELDPWVVERTLGVKGANTVTPETILRSTQKLLNINRGDEQDDDRDAPEFSNVHSVEDFIKERVDKDAGRTMKNLMFKVGRKGNLSPLYRGALNPYMESLIYNSGLVSPLEETNPIHILDQSNRQVKFGEGGLGDDQALTDEARDVNPGHVGFLDLIATPESTRAGTDLRYAFGTYKGDDNQMHAEFIDASNGKKVFLKPEDMHDKVLAFPGQDGEKEVHVMRNGKMDRVPAEDVDYYVPTYSHMYNPTINLTPMPTGFMPGRALFSAKYWSQFLPVVNGEAPLVKSRMPGTDRSFNEYYGRKVGALNAKVPGVVTRVTDDVITITGEDGKKNVIETVKNFPFNRMTQISYDATVKEGDVVKPGDMIAKSNFVDDKGEFNMGMNLRTAVLPYRGHSFEDAYVISSTAANKLSTEKLYGYDVDQKRGVKVGMNTYISAFPRQFVREQLDKLDRDGVIKPGSVVNKGDPLILATGPRVLSAKDAKLGNLHKVLRNTFRDESQVWDYDAPGIVTDVALTARGAKVNVKSVSPVQVGDKLVTQHSSKGVVGKIVDDEEMPRDPATNEPYEMLFNPMVVLSRIAPNQLVEMQLAKIAKKTGKPYILPQEAPPEGWEQFAQNELVKYGLKEDGDVYDPGTGKTIKNVGEGIMYISPFHHLSEKKLCVTTDTEFMTDEGWVSGADLKGCHRLYTKNRKTGIESWQHMTAINFYRVDGQVMYEIDDDNQELIVTADHGVVVDQDRDCPETERAEALYSKKQRGII